MKKFELTANTRIKYGRTLIQIKAAFSFGFVEKGQLGGWVEKESSLGDDVWIYPEAEVFQDAVIKGGVIKGGEIWGGEIRGGEIRGGVIRGGVIRGGEIRGGEIRGGVIWGGEIRGGVIKITPIFLAGLRWDITVTSEHMTIGCQHFTHKEWEGFTRVEITPMASKAWDWWKENKAMLFNFCKKQVADYAALNEEE